MYAVVAKKRKISKPTMDQPSAEENNIGMLFRVNQNYFKTLVFCSAHQAPSFTNPELQFPQFKVLQSGFIFLCKELYWHFLMYFGLSSKLLSCQHLLTK